MTLHNRYMLLGKSALALTLVTAIAASMFPGVAAATVIDFNFTGLLTVASDYNNSHTVVPNSSAGTFSDPAGYRTPIAASLVYDTNLGISSSTLSITMPNFFGYPVTIHDITTSSVSGNLINAQLLVDWNGNYNMPTIVQWDATGLVNATSYGLQVGDKISGNSLYRPDGNGGYLLIASNLGSAQPYSDTVLQNCYTNNNGCSYVPPLQNFAPLAATSATQGLISGPFPGMRTYLDIGSGNSMDVTSISSVPVPATLWLFGSGLLGLASFARRRKQ